MQQSNKILLRNNLSKFLSNKGVDTKLANYKYIIKIDKSDTKELTSNMEQIINFVVLPKKVNQIQTIEEVLSTLVTGKNDIPLWAGVNVKLDKKLIELHISRRFKKLKVVQDRLTGNQYVPFVDITEINSTDKTNEFHFLYPSSMYDEPGINCEEFQEIVNVLNLGIIDYETIERKILENGENKNADILKIKSKDNEVEYVLLDLWNHDQINVMNCYFKTIGVNSAFVSRSLNKWNNRLWQDLGPKIKNINNIEEQDLVKGRRIVNYETKNAV